MSSLLHCCIGDGRHLDKLVPEGGPEEGATEQVEQNEVHS